MSKLTVITSSVIGAVGFAASVIGLYQFLAVDTYSAAFSSLNRGPENEQYVQGEDGEGSFYKLAKDELEFVKKMIEAAEDGSNTFFLAINSNSLTLNEDFSLGYPHREYGTTDSGLGELTHVYFKGTGNTTGRFQGSRFCRYQGDRGVNLAWGFYKIEYFDAWQGYRIYNAQPLDVRNEAAEATFRQHKASTQCG